MAKNRVCKMFDDPINSASPLIRRTEKALRANHIIRSQFTDFFKSDAASLTIPAYSRKNGLHLKTYVRLDADNDHEIVIGKRVTEDAVPKGFFEKIKMLGVRTHPHSVTTQYNNHARTNPQVMIMDFETDNEAAHAHAGMKYGYA